MVCAVQPERPCPSLPNPAWHSRPVPALRQGKQIPSHLQRRLDTPPLKCSPAQRAEILNGESSKQAAKTHAMSELCQQVAEWPGNFLLPRYVSGQMRFTHTRSRCRAMTLGPRRWSRNDHRHRAVHPSSCYLAHFATPRSRNVASHGIVVDLVDDSRHQLPMAVENALLKVTQAGNINGPRRREGRTAYSRARSACLVPIRRLDFVRLHYLAWMTAGTTPALTLCMWSAGSEAGRSRVNGLGDDASLFRYSAVTSGISSRSHNSLHRANRPAGT